VTILHPRESPKKAFEPKDVGKLTHTRFEI